MQNKRVTGKEQYYTPVDTASQCVNILRGLVETSGKTWLEPAGGTGAFLDAIRSSGVDDNKIVSFDIEPKHKLVRKTPDFLQENLSNLKDVITITNPPFGRANKLSVPFFNKCADVSDVIAFIVPKSWRKWSVQNRLHPNFHLIYDTELVVDYIEPEEKERSKGKLATVFQIWERREQVRPKIKVENRGYIEKTSPTDANVCVTVFGRGCGKVETDFQREPNTTKMFLRAKNAEVISALQNVDYSQFYNNVAFVEALSIQEIMFLLNEHFDGSGA